MLFVSPHQQYIVLRRDIKGYRERERERMTSYLRQKFGVGSSLKSSDSEKEKEDVNVIQDQKFGVGSSLKSSDSEKEKVDVNVTQEVELHQDTINSSEISDIEQTKITVMRAIVEAQDPSSKEEDDYMIRRFLRARDLDIEKASALFLKYRSWRKEFVPNGFISPSEIQNDLAHEKLFMQGQDKMGRPIVVVFGGRHKQTSLDEFKRFATYTLDKICARMPRGKEKFVAIGDLEGWGYSNCDIRGYLAALSILQDCYPERLGKLYIIHVPYIFMTAWKVVYPFIDNKTKKKIIFVENKKLRPTLLSDIDESQLPEIYGGKMPLVPIQEC